MVSFASCTKVRKKPTPIGSGVSDTGEVDPPMDVLIYTGSASWIILENATVEAKTTKKLLESNGIRAVITESEGSLIVKSRNKFTFYEIYVSVIAYELFNRLTQMRA